MKTPLHNKILIQIQEQNIAPKARWKFIIKEISLWTGTVLSLLLASFAAGSFIFQSANISLVPPHLLFWFGFVRIVVILLFIILAIYQLLRIGQGYRRTKRRYLIIGFIIVGVVGVVFFASRLAGNIEQGIGRGGLIIQAQEYWSEPLKTGLLAGELIEITGDGYLLIRGLNDSTHIVDAQFIDEQKQEIFIDFLRVKMVGYESLGIFYPCAVASWEIRQAGRERNADYPNIFDGNLQFSKVRESHNDFKNTFERKDKILRSNSC